MPRHPRVHAPGLLHHVIARGNNRQRVFFQTKDYELFLEALHAAKQRYPFYLYAYALLPNHFHLLVQVKDAPTSRLMQSLLTGYVRGFNRRHHRRGHLFEGRYKAIVCDRDSYLLELVRYIHLNPTRAGLVRRPGEWKWSGHGEYLGKAKRGLIDPGPVMEEFGTSSHYEAFVRDGIGVAYRAELHPSDNAPFLGTEKLANEFKAGRPTSKLTMPPLSLLLEEAAVHAGITVNALRAQGRNATVVRARDRFIRQAVNDQGYRASEVAKFLGCHASNISRALQRGTLQY